MSQRTGNRGFGGGATKKYTRGGTTSDTKTKEDYEFQLNSRGQRVKVTPKPLIMSQSRHKETKQAPEGHEESKEQSSDAQPRDSSQNKTDNKTFAVTNVQQDGLTSSLLETSEDEEAQRRREAELAKKKIKGLTEK